MQFLLTVLRIDKMSITVKQSNELYWEQYIDQNVSNLKRFTEDTFDNIASNLMQKQRVIECICKLYQKFINAWTHRISFNNWYVNILTNKIWKTLVSKDFWAILYITSISYSCNEICSLHTLITCINIKYTRNLNGKLKKNYYFQIKIRF